MESLIYILCVEVSLYPDENETLYVCKYNLFESNQRPPEEVLAESETEESEEL